MMKLFFVSLVPLINSAQGKFTGNDLDRPEMILRHFSSTLSFYIPFRFDGTDGQDITNMAEWKGIVESRYHHKKSRLANYKGKPFIVGSRGAGTAENKHTELLQKMAGTLSWAALRDYPYGTYFGGGISAYATASTASAAYILGGYEHATPNGHALSTVAKYENDSWSRVGGPTGGLLASRYGHNAIWLEDELFVIGGHQTK